MFRVMLVSLLFAVAAGSSLNNRVVGGEDANIRAYPYQISVQYEGEHVCGGALVSRSKVVTAAGCTFGYQISKMSIRHSHSAYANGISESVASMACHPSYSSPGLDYDICVLTLVRSIPEQYIALPIPLVAAGTPDGTRTGTVTGWGVSTTNGWKPSPSLKSASVQEVNKDKCNESFPNKITDTVLCFSATTATDKGPCKYDSGSPIVVDGELVGLVALGMNCYSATSQIPSIYVNIASLRDFLDAQLN